MHNNNEILIVNATESVHNEFHIYNNAKQVLKNAKIKVMTYVLLVYSIPH